MARLGKQFAYKTFILFICLSNELLSVPVITDIPIKWSRRGIYMRDKNQSLRQLLGEKPMLDLIFSGGKETSRLWVNRDYPMCFSSPCNDDIEVKHFEVFFLSQQYVDCLTGNHGTLNKCVIGYRLAQKNSSTSGSCFISVKNLFHADLFLEKLGHLSQRYGRVTF